MDIVTSHFGKMSLWPVEHFYNPAYVSSLLGVIAEYNTSNHAPKWGQIFWKSVQLVRGSSFRNDLLQYPYFDEKSTSGPFFHILQTFEFHDIWFNGYFKEKQTLKKCHVKSWKSQMFSRIYS